jgi:hypothetical protein
MIQGVRCACVQDENRGRIHKDGIANPGSWRALSCVLFEDIML